MAEPEKGPRVHLSKGYGKWLFLLLRGEIAIVTIMSLLALSPTHSKAQARLGNDCLPPVEPYVPVSEQEFRMYADFVATEYEQYFAEITAYLACMDQARQAAFVQAQIVSQSYRKFHDRASRLGLLDKTAVQNVP